MARLVDHIVYGVPDLEFGIRYFEEKLGVVPTFGGYHKTQGTKNALLNLSNACYLEILTVDPNNHHVTQGRWMGVDLLESPKLIRWAIKSTDLTKDGTILQKYDPRMGEILPGSRQTASGELLKWELIMPLNAPEVEVIPFVLDWSQSAMHPTEALSASGFLLDKIQLTHPEPMKINSTLQELNVEVVVVEGEISKINAVLKGPNGIQFIL